MPPDRRLVSRAPPRSRCSPCFVHGLLARGRRGAARRRRSGRARPPFPGPPAGWSAARSAGTPLRASAGGPRAGPVPPRAAVSLRGVRVGGGPVAQEGETPFGGEHRGVERMSPLEADLSRGQPAFGGLPGEPAELPERPVQGCLFGNPPGRARLRFEEHRLQRGMVEVPESGVVETPEAGGEAAGEAAGIPGHLLRKRRFQFALGPLRVSPGGLRARRERKERPAEQVEMPPVAPVGEDQPGGAETPGGPARGPGCSGARRGAGERGCSTRRFRPRSGSLFPRAGTSRPDRSRDRARTTSRRARCPGPAGRGRPDARRAHRPRSWGVSRARGPSPPPG